MTGYADKRSPPLWRTTSPWSRSVRSGGPWSDPSRRSVEVGTADGVEVPAGPPVQAGVDVEHLPRIEQSPRIGARLPEAAGLLEGRPRGRKLAVRPQGVGRVRGGVAAEGVAPA